MFTTLYKCTLPQWHLDHSTRLQSGDSNVYGSIQTLPMASGGVVNSGQWAPPLIAWISSDCVQACILHSNPHLRCLWSQSECANSFQLSAPDFVSFIASPPSLSSSSCIGNWDQWWKLRGGQVETTAIPKSGWGVRPRGERRSEVCGIYLQSFVQT